MQTLTTTKSNPNATTSPTKKPARTTHQRRTNTNKHHVRIMEDEEREEMDREGQPMDKTVYETAGIIDRIDRLKAKVEGELTKEAGKSRWFSECQRSIEEKKVNKTRSDHTELWSLPERSSSIPSHPSLSSTDSVNGSSNE